MELRKLSSWNFRNLHGEALEFGSRINLILGANGQGKTNLLEAIATLGNLRSFRRAAARKMVRHGENAFRLEGLIEGFEGRFRIRQLLELGPPVRRQLEINGAPVGLEEYLAAFPVFTLSSADTELVVGSPERRRALLDRLAFFGDQRHLVALREYRRCLRQRNALLVHGCSEAEMDIWETHLATAAARVVVRRDRAMNQWAETFAACHSALRGDDFQKVEAVYRMETEIDTSDEAKVAENYRQRYHGNRRRDRHAGFTIEGPHRHDLSLRAGGRSVRDVLSAGQVKVVAGALCISTLMQVEERRKERLPVLIDDADAEIDDRVFARLVALLGDERQVFMSSAHEINIRRVVHGEAIHWVDAGMITENRPQARFEDE
ncbi:MAG: DNA replication and repair protein RecF [Thermoanaerobaculales bacterium]|nr:DNA replication and repair protein RecF [Thermoanaerobaculales bacterium]